MKPAPIKFLKASSVRQAVAWLAEYGPDAKLVAGGQSLIPLMNLRLARPQYLVDLNGIPELDAIKVENGRLRIGALVRHADVVRSPLVQKICPLLTEAVSMVGHAAIRNRGTLGGSLAHADPVAEIPTAALALGAGVTVQGPDGKRTIPVEELFLTYFTTTLAPEEVLVEVDFPVQEVGEGWAFVEEARRAGDFALVSVAAGVRLAPDGTLTEVRLVAGGVGATPFVADMARAVGRFPEAELWRELAQATAAATDPEDDLHASAGLRRHLLQHLAVDALTRAAGRATENGGEPIG